LHGDRDEPDEREQRIAIRLPAEPPTNDDS
jgi:hypothetical protein